MFAGTLRKSLLTFSLISIACLPAIAKVPTVQIGTNKVKLEVASTREQIERGLMYRNSMPEDHGMVFLFHPPSGVKFWMAHCYMPLDMLMIKDGRIARIFENVQPERDKPESQCPTYPSASEPAITVDEVVEVNAGYAKRHNIKAGDAVEFSFDSRKAHPAASDGSPAGDGKTSTEPK
jgi:uncharacterized membrane protein (UPF0127 family)